MVRKQSKGLVNQSVESKEVASRPRTKEQVKRGRGTFKVEGAACF